MCTLYQKRGQGEKDCWTKPKEDQEKPVPPYNLVNIVCKEEHDAAETRLQSIASVRQGGDRELRPKQTDLRDSNIMRNHIEA